MNWRLICKCHDPIAASHVCPGELNLSGVPLQKEYCSSTTELLQNVVMVTPTGEVTCTGSCFVYFHVQECRFRNSISLLEAKQARIVVPYTVTWHPPACP
jgi:hypothetical protein